MKIEREKTLFSLFFNQVGSVGISCSSVCMIAFVCVRCNVLITLLKHV